jgi:hypothetical protein
MIDGHLRIRGMQAADVLVIEAAAGSHEYFIKGPLARVFHSCSDFQAATLDAD